MSPTEDAVDYSLFGGADSLNEGKTQRAPRRCVPSTPTAQDNGVTHLHPPQDPQDFLWLLTEEPHRSRRMAILKKHPEVRKLMGHTPLTKYIVLLVVSIQILTARTLAYSLRLSPLSWKFLLVSYAIGGTANHNLFLAIHEITHNLAFKGVWPNRLLALFANLPIGIPYAAAFKKYHIDHHKHQGEDGIDTDLPTRLELVLLNNVLGKTFFATFQILFYALRPTFVAPIPITSYHLFTLFIQLSFNLLMWFLWGPNVIWYLLFSSFWAGSLHPCAGHFIAEHYVWDGSSQETYSYYGPLNILAYNVGYHNEHHDFPSVPWTRLPTLRALAPEFYDTIPAHPSWVMVIVNFLRDRDVGMHARVKREAGLNAKMARAAAAAAVGVQGGVKGKEEVGNVEKGAASKIVKSEESGEESDKSL